MPYVRDGPEWLSCIPFLKKNKLNLVSIYYLFWLFRIYYGGILALCGIASIWNEKKIISNITAINIDAHTVKQAKR